MTRHQLFAAVMVGAGALILISSAFSSGEYDDNFVVVVDHDRGHRLSGDEVSIESNGSGLVVRTKDGTIDCKKNGGTVVINREDGSSTEITCD
ncbi:MAG: hypothetical protein HWE25_14465 [Alphaproteobacteria bacterium]|nr:hypothetical protein [Alphaproteobacteria bacterium]